MYIFPVHLFNPGTIKAAPRARVIDGGVSLTGEQDVISADGGGRWYIDFDDISIINPNLERWWAQWNSYLNGGARVVQVPVVSLRTAPRPLAGGRPLKPSDMDTDDTVFPTTTAFALPYIVASAATSVAVGGTTMSITITKGARLQGGEIFSRNGRAYVVERVTAVSGQTATIVFNPPARAAIAAGDALNFEWPTVQCRAVIGQDLGAAISFKYGSVAVSFVEDFSDV